MKKRKPKAIQEDPTGINVAGQFHVLFTKLPDGETIASIPFPSKMEGPSSATRVTVDFQTGCLKNIAKNVKFITGATMLEVNDAQYRVACDRNKAFLNTLSFDKGSLWGFAPALRDTLNALPTSVRKVRLLGGDLLCTEMLESIYECMADTDKVMYVQTSRVDILNDIGFSEKPLNALVFCRIPNFSEELNLHSYPYARMEKDAAHTDLETYPANGTDDVSYKPDPGSDTVLRTRKPWWQQGF